MKSNLDELVTEILNKSDNKKLKERLNSYQFKLSQEILGQRVKQNLTQNEAAQKVGLSLEDYLNFERGLNATASEREYKDILNILK